MSRKVIISTVYEFNIYIQSFLSIFTLILIHELAAYLSVDLCLRDRDCPLEKPLNPVLLN